MRVDVHVPWHDDGAGVERDPGVRRFDVVRCNGGQASIVSQFFVQYAGGRACGWCLCLVNVIQAQEQGQEDRADDEHAAGAASKDLVHGPKAGFAFGQAWLDFDSPGAAIDAGSRVGDARRSLPDLVAVVCRLHGTRPRSHDLEKRQVGTRLGLARCLSVEQLVGLEGSKT